MAQVEVKKDFGKFCTCLQFKTITVMKYHSVREIITDNHLLPFPLEGAFPLGLREGEGVGRGVGTGVATVFHS